jgi:hypothetical protein
MQFSEAWKSIPAVRDGRIFTLDANGVVSRPAGRLITGIEAMAKAMHPGIRVRKKVQSVLLPINEFSPNTRSTAAGALGS